MNIIAAIELIKPTNNGQKVLPSVPADQSTLQTLFTIFFVIIGAVAVLLILIAAFKYLFSQGDPQKTASAKNTIIHAAIGLIIAAMAFVIVSYVIKATG